MYATLLSHGTHYTQQVCVILLSSSTCRCTLLYCTFLLISNQSEQKQLEADFSFVCIYATQVFKN